MELHVRKTLQLGGRVLSSIVRILPSSRAIENRDKSDSNNSPHSSKRRQLSTIRAMKSNRIIFIS